MDDSNRRRRIPFSHVLLLAIGATLLGSGNAQAQSAGGLPTPNAAFEQRRELERANLLRQEQERSVDVRRPTAEAAEALRISEAETPCFTIDRLQLAGDDDNRYGWILDAAAGPKGDDSPVGRCIGGQGINLTLRRMQNALIARGLITSRVTAAPQDLKSGTLVLNLALGRIHTIRFAGDAGRPVSLRSTVPARAGDVLNLRDIEQALENFKRVPSADADIKIEPADTPGESDLVITYRKAFPLRATLSADDSGTKATGKYQGNAIIAYDNPLNLSDSMYLSLGHDLSGHGGAHGTDAVLAHYSVPFGYWSAGLTVDRNRDHQTVAGAFENYIYRGSNSNAEFKLSRLVYRDGSRKSTVSLAAFRRASRNYIDDTEVAVQRRVVGGWIAALNHREFIGTATVDATLSHKFGTGAFGGIAAPEEAFGEGTSRFRLTTVDLSLDLPFTVLGRRLAYQGSVRGQWNHTRLTPQDMFVIGGRYTVRGFDGETVLSAERGWLLCNEVALPLGAAAVEAYLGADYGEVGGPSSGLLLGKRLAGAVAGVRGSFKRLGYEFFVGAPIAKPVGFKTARATTGFRLNYSF